MKVKYAKVRSRDGLPKGNTDTAGHVGIEIEKSKIIWI